MACAYGRIGLCVAIGGNEDGQRRAAVMLYVKESAPRLLIMLS